MSENKMKMLWWKNEMTRENLICIKGNIRMVVQRRTKCKK